ncbi:MAG: aminotransferase class I/II-fold pyridoxal phosphate-dependent enzyme [Candidatus Micrarchaeota archaeon]
MGKPNTRPVFREGRHGERAVHVARINGVVFDKTDVGQRIAHYSRTPFGNPRPIIEGRFGDPTCYPGLGPYSGVERHEARARFYPPNVHSGYVMGGDPTLKEWLRQGRKNVEDKIQVPDGVGVYITAGVAGALRLISDATLFPLALDFNQDHLNALRTKLDRGTFDAQDQTELSALLRRLHQTTPDNVVVPEWTYPSHLAETYRAHGQVKICPIDKNGQVDLAKLKKTIDKNTRTVLFATVGNPLSVAMEPERFDEILRIVSAKMKEYGHPIILVADTIYEPFRRPGSVRIDPIQRALRLNRELDPPAIVIQTSSFSKMMAIPGQRVGYFCLYWEENLFPNERFNLLKALQLLYSPTLCPVSQKTQWALGMLYSGINANVPLDEKFVPIAAALSALKRLKDRKSLDPEAPEGFYSVNTDVCVTAFAEMSDELVDGDYGLRASFRVQKFLDLLKDVVFRGKPLIEIKEVGDKKFYKLVADIPDLPVATEDSGGIPYNITGIKRRLYGTVYHSDWYAIALACGIPTEWNKYEDHKTYMRETVFSRTMEFVNALDELRSEGIYIHPAYYVDGDPSKGLDPNKINAFYVLWGIDKLRRYVPDGLSQSARLVEECVKVGGPMIANTPGELFLPPEYRSDQTSYQRHVALLDSAHNRLMIETIRRVARQL